MKKKGKPETIGVTPGNASTARNGSPNAPGSSRTSWRVSPTLRDGSARCPTTTISVGSGGGVSTAAGGSSSWARRASVASRHAPVRPRSSRRRTLGDSRATDKVPETTAIAVQRSSAAARRQVPVRVARLTGAGSAPISVSASLSSYISKRCRLVTTGAACLGGWSGALDRRWISAPRGWPCADSNSSVLLSTRGAGELTSRPAGRREKYPRLAANPEQS
jgi:hypothetical protein